ncbi:MAG: nitrate reductase [Polyangiales bacterium]|nr:nitrate reductase [Myxococcales bacterium]MCB9660601.1 nitrate reductase [Sandaracinaceae bacterium]
MAKVRPTIVQRAKRLLRDDGGVLTRELMRSPGGFGLGQVPTRLKPDSTTTMVCGFCSTGCGLDVHMRDGAAVSLTPSALYPVNLGMACPKGWESLAPLRAPDRARSPMLRMARGGRLTPIGWREALTTFTERFKAIQAKHGPASVAFLGTGQIPMEELAYLGALAKFGMGMRHGDGNTRQCMATAVVAYKECFGFDAPPYSYEDFEESDTLIFVGANPCIAHPILWERVCRNPNDPTVVVIDPRRTETAQQATMHLPLAPKSDLELLYAVAHVLIRDGKVDHDFIANHTDDYDGFADHVRAYSPSRVADRVGLPPSEIEALADIIARGKRVSFWWTMGVNQSHEGVRVAQALIALSLLTGNIGRPGTGPNSITGQCNAMGSRLFSNTTSLLGGHRFDDPAHRQKVASSLGIDEGCIPTDAGYAYDQILEAILRDEIKGLWVVATNPSHSWINQSDARDVLSRLDFLVVQDMYDSSETADQADLILPAAGWGEKEGCFINSERRISVIKQVARAPGNALSDFRIFQLIADAWGCGEMFRKWDSPEAVFNVLKELTRDMPCDITGIEGYQQIDAMRGIQWPLPEGRAPQKLEQRRLFEDRRFHTPNGRARFRFEDTRPIPEKVDAFFRFTLLTGRGSSAQWHTQTRTGKSPVLGKLAPEDQYVEISPADAEELGIAPNGWVRVSSRRGSLVARAYVTHIVQPGHVFIPMHYVETNKLTFPAFDPSSRQPSYKYSAVRLEKVSSNDIPRGSAHVFRD